MVGASKVNSIADLFDLHPVFESSATHNKSNHLDQIYTNLPFKVNEMVPIESVKDTTDHNPLLVRVCLSDKSIEQVQPRLT